MSILFISDLHLQDDQPAIHEILLGFLAGPAREAEALYILGDLFEYWIGDDALSGVARELAKHTSQLSAAGVEINFMHGNRDFLLGADYARLASFTLLPESIVVDLYGTPTLLLHGDTLCTDDVKYQAFRRQSRDPRWQAAVLARSVEERLQMAREARDASMQHGESVSMEIMDVNEAAVLEAFRSSGTRRMIHGHTHRPAVHHLVSPGGGNLERIVLADWYANGSYLEVSGEGTRSVTL